MKRYQAEFIGTYMLVLCGTGSIIVNQETGGLVTHTGISLTFGMIVTIMILVFGRISGAHINPVVTIALNLSGSFSGKEIPGYIVSQITGAIAASATLGFLFPYNEMLGSTMPAGNWVQAAILEFLLTFFLMMTILYVSSFCKSRTTGALLIGAVVGLEAFFAGPFTGASMNPARSAGPAIISGHTEYLWIYLIICVLGAASAVPIFKMLFNTMAYKRG